MSAAPTSDPLKFMSMCIAYGNLEYLNILATLGGSNSAFFEWEANDPLY